MNGTPTTTFSAWSCTMRLAVTDARALRPATADLQALLARVEGAASRFHADSELSRANRRAGTPTPISQLLVDLVGAALDAADRSDGAVDPTLGAALRHLGYDRDFADVAGDGPPIATHELRLGAWRAVRLHSETGILTVPAGTALDLGATAKAWTADTAARTLAARYRTAVLVELGGDVAVAGTFPWRIRVSERGGAERDGSPGQLVLLRQGGLATSTTTVRAWRRGGATLHHIVDPRTGLPASGPWRTASVAASSALEANTASTAAIVHGAGARAWLTAHGFAARLVAQDGGVHPVGAWPVRRGHVPGTATSPRDTPARAEITCKSLARGERVS